MKRRVFLITGIVLILLAGCENDLTQSTDHQTTMQQQSTEPLTRASLEDLRDIPRLEVDMPEEARLWDQDVSVLQDSISANDGRAMIGLKAENSVRLMESGGIREALKAEQFLKGIRTLEDLGVEIAQIYDSFGAVSVLMDPDLTSELIDHPMVDYIEIPATYRLDSVKIEDDIRAEISMLNQVTPWGVDLVRAPVAWSEATGTGARVMVIDSGMHPHEDLPVPPTSNCGGSFGGCSDGPLNFHGTHVSGIIMARNNQIGVVGVAPGVSAGNTYSWGACGQGIIGCDVDEVTSGINFASSNDIDVINMSLGSETFHTGLANAASAAWDAGIVLVAAAGNIPSPTGGNPGDPVYPAAYSQVIGVSGVNTIGTFASTSPCSDYSNHGSHVSISAPFWALSTVGVSGYEDESQGWCGTSMAAPHVAGAAALLIEQNPTWPNSSIRQRLQDTARHPAGSVPPDHQYGHGVLDVGAALGFTRPIEPDIDGPTFIQVNQPAQYTANTYGGVQPYSYQWQIDYNMGTGPWQNVGGDADFYGHESFNDNDFALRVIVTDAENDSETALPIFVTVSW